LAESPKFVTEDLSAVLVNFHGVDQFAFSPSRSITQVTVTPGIRSTGSFRDLACFLPFFPKDYAESMETVYIVPYQLERIVAWICGFFALV